ncbi:TnsA endonuclease N-terminal domain-containing protein [Shewanella sp. 5_MG-2023]|uniref:TnsA endonuclease N-terminal domain-containing protein n=1 Tax=unclassified Shewanella TaxID=196818 RepID=UPI000C85CDBC|nr:MULTISPECIES: TnsA endonuclease N-terminal domain-containing protein [unclassified Shewanella]MDO6642068.1 TnsA endonuclease N-terminal domain-containing protein [Shewanella sp. 5_MG-2023]PMH99879.1 endonuclease [Shewanella sp. 10N.286.48.A6]
MKACLSSPEVVNEALKSAFYEPARNLTKSRGKNIHRYVSTKSGQRISVESTLEFDACFHFDFDKSIRRFCSQPIRYNYLLDGKKRTYVPDFLAEFNAGEFVLFEVKTNSETDSESFKREFEAKKRAAEQLGIPLELLKESEIRDTQLLKNLKLLHRYASRDDLTHYQQAILSILSDFGSQNVESLMHKIGMNRVGIMPMVCDLLARCLLDADLEMPLTNQTVLNYA